MEHRDEGARDRKMKGFHRDFYFAVLVPRAIDGALGFEEPAIHIVLNHNSSVFAPNA
jgi:hypothetical protein